MTPRGAGASAAEPQSIEARVRAILKKVAPGAGEVDGAGTGDNLFELGILDSIALIPLALEIEKGFRLRIPNADLEPANFKTIAALTSFVAQCLESSAE